MLAGGFGGGCGVKWRCLEKSDCEILERVPSAEVLETPSLGTSRQVFFRKRSLELLLQAFQGVSGEWLVRWQHPSVK